MNTERNSELLGDDVPNRIRSLVIDRDGEQCRICGNTRQLEIHHIVFRSKGRYHDLCNLILLCSFCHDQAEQGGLPEWNKPDKTALYHLSPVKGFSHRFNFNKILCNTHELKISDTQKKPPITAYQYRNQKAVL